MHDTLSDTTFRFNEATLPWVAGLRVSDVLEHQDLAPERVATALNGAFVPRTARAGTLIAPGDTLTAFQAIVGG
jgi:sulfur carrier protein